MVILKNTSDTLNSWSEKLVCILLGAMTLVVFAQVIFRLFKASLPWSEELARYMMIYLTFIGASIGVKRGSHIAVEALMGLVREKYQKYVSLLVVLLCMAFFVILVVFGSKVVGTTMSQLSPAMKVNMGLVYLAIPLSGLLMIIHSLNEIFEIFKKTSCKGDI